MSLAQTKNSPNCQDVIKSCNKVLAAKKKELEESDLALQRLQTNSAELHKEVQSLRDRDSSLLRNPVFMFVLGGLAATTTYILLKK